MMRHSEKQAYTSPEFYGTAVQLEAGLCVASGQKVEESHIKVDIAEQSGWNESYDGSFISNKVLNGSASATDD